MAVQTKQGGFTLVELMMTVVLLAIFATVALPGFNGFVKNNRTLAFVTELKVLSSYARLQALTNKSQYSLSYADNGEWAVKAANDQQVKQAAERIIFSDNLTISSAPFKITYDFNGMLSSASKKVRICADNDPHTGFEIFFRKSGSVKLSQRGRDVDGNALQKCT